MDAKLEQYAQKNIVESVNDVIRISNDYEMPATELDYKWDGGLTENGFTIKVKDLRNDCYIEGLIPGKTCFECSSILESSEIMKRLYARIES